MAKMAAILARYQAGMAAYDRCHSPTVASQWQAFRAEVSEFLEQPSFAELWDMLHSAGRLVWRLTGVPLQLLAWPTVRKHAQRFAESGCIRSPRNCQGYCCSPTDER
jgi:hypothetical protein